MTELELLRVLYRATVAMRDAKGASANRLSPTVRHALNSLDAHYSEGDVREERPLKHEDCSCAECRKPSSATSKITIPLADAPAVISDSVRAVLTAHNLTACRSHVSYVETVTGAELDALIREIGNNTAMALTSLDETPDEEPAPRAARGRR